MNGRQGKRKLRERKREKVIGMGSERKQREWERKPSRENENNV